MRAVRLLRQILGVGQADLARRAGVSRRALARIESGESHPQQETAQELDRAFDEVIDQRAAAKAALE